MSEDQTTVEESTATDPVETEGEDNDVSRLTRALEHEREERRQAKEELRLLREDEDAQRRFLAELGYEIDDTDTANDEDEDAFDVEDDTNEDPRVSQHDQWIREQQEAQQQAAVKQQWDGWQQFIAEKAGDAELRQADINHLRVLCVGDDMLPIPPAKAEKVLTDYLAERDQWLESQVAARSKRPRVPHVPGGGQPPADKDPADMTRQEIQAYMLDRLRAESA